MLGCTKSGPRCGGTVSSRFVVTGTKSSLCDQQSCEELVKDCVQQEAGRKLAILPDKKRCTEDGNHRWRMSMTGFAGRAEA